MPPASEPSSAAPAQMTTGKRSISHRISPEPAITSGIDSSNPKITSPKWPSAAAAMASTLSRLITASATTMVHTALHKEFAPAT